MHAARNTESQEVNGRSYTDFSHPRFCETAIIILSLTFVQSFCSSLVCGAGKTLEEINNPKKEEEVGARSGALESSIFFSRRRKRQAAEEDDEELE